jgi:DNA-directed RNA polymerase sigma subunit (sigma70/sigma32)
MTTSTHPDHDAAGLFVADFYPRLGEYLAKRQSGGYDATAGRARFQAWLTEHAEADEADPLEAYLARISQIPELSAEQEAALAARIKAGRDAERELASGGGPSGDGRADLEWIAADGRRARTELLEANLRLVIAVARRFSGRGVAFGDLVQEGNLGLVRAVEKFDHTKGYRFPAYATWWIRQAITRAVLGHGCDAPTPTPRDSPG